MSDSLQVTIKPLASAYFAGETLVVHITLTNNAPPPKVAPSRTPSHRATQSLAVPHTPSTAPPDFLAPRLAAQQHNGIRTPLSASFAALPKSVQDDMLLPTRKGLIGSKIPPKEVSPVRASLYQAKRLPAGHKRQNYSVALSSSNDLDDVSAQQAALNYVQQFPVPLSKDDPPDSPNVNITISPSPSSSALSSPSHTHFASGLPRSVSDKSLVDSTPRTSIDFYAQGRSESMDSLIRESLTNWTGRPPLGRTSSTPHTLASPDIPSRWRNSEALPPKPGAQTLLWAFAQLQGSFEVDETLIKPAEFVAVKRSLFGHPSLAPQTRGSRIGLIGGGTLNPPAAASSGSWKDWLWSTSAPPDHSEEPNSSARRSSGISVAGGAQGAGSLADRWSRAFSDKSIPVFSVPPALFAVDLTLQPGESKTYAYALRLPGDLPPSFQGRSVKFVYDLIVGANKSSSRGGKAQQRSRMLHLPLRIYNNVAASGARPFYDLTNPIVWFKDEADITSVANAKQDTAIAKATATSLQGAADFEDYAAKLLNAAYTSPNLSTSKATSQGDLLSPTLNGWTRSPPSESSWAPSQRHEMQARTSMAKPALELDDEVTGCVNAIELVSRSSPKASYDIKKDGYLVASVTFVKSAFRLGETIYGAVALNLTDARVLRMTARLETHEQIETTISVKNAQQVRQATRKLHSEHHETTLDTSRIMLALAIPSGATPDFATSGVKLQWSIRLSFFVIPPVATDPNPAASAPGSRSSSLHSRNMSSSSNYLGYGKDQHSRSKSYSFGAADKMVDPVPVPTGTHHIMPIPSACTTHHTSYRGVPDLAFSPVLFQSAEDATNAATSPTTAHGPFSPGSLFASDPVPEVHGSVVLMPNKTETIEVSIPIKVFPLVTPFLPTEVSFRL